MGDTLHSIMTRVVAYVAVAIAAGLLFLAGATIYALMWPKPVVPLSQMSDLQLDDVMFAYGSRSEELI
jgi:hypothetical protein